MIWFILSLLSVGILALDIRTTPAHPVIKWAFAILALFMGPLALLLYVFGCREPLRTSHESFVAARWRSALGSTMHCAAGDGLGIIVGAALAARSGVTGWADMALEYALGFGFGWMIFQALAMRGMAGGSYSRSLRQTFMPEFVSMNFLMAGMVATRLALTARVTGAEEPSSTGFWLVMSMALTIGFVMAYPVNWWLVARSLKHGMITVRNAEPATPPRHQGDYGTHSGTMRRSPLLAWEIAGVAALSVLALGTALALRAG